jgi:hypothetical protein
MIITVGRLATAAIALSSRDKHQSTSISGDREIEEGTFVTVPPQYNGF